MGSWDGTCMVSQLPISYEDKIKVFLLQQVSSLAENGGGYTSCSPIYRAMSLPLTGIYDTYGCVEEVEDDINSQVLIHCLPGIVNGVQITERAKEYWSGTKKKEDPTDWDKLMQFLLFVERDGVTKKNYQGEKVGVGLVMIREEIYNFCVDHGRKSFDDVESGAWNNVPEKASELKKTLLEMASRPAPDKKDSEAQSTSLSDSFQVREEISRIFGTFSLMPIREALSCASLYQNFENTKTLPVETIGPLFDSMMEVFYFESFLEATRKAWMVQTGKGAQEWGLDGYHAHIALAQKIIEVGGQEIENYGKEE
jgi:hypothetical protein